MRPSPDLHQPDMEAPTYRIPDRTISAVEHPMIVKDTQKAIKTFGNNFNFQTILDHESAQLSVPLYLRYDNPLARPVVSHNALSHNVLLKVDVPKRTGRKRKRGSDDPWQEEEEDRRLPGISGRETHPPSHPALCSQQRLDHPRLLKRKLQDNVGKYEVEAVGLVRNTHRYRGLVDFQYSSVNAPFVSSFAEKIIPGDVSKLRQFSFRPGTAQPPRVEIVPPPVFTHMNLPFIYNFTQNPYVRAVDDRIVNVTARHKSAGFFIPHNRYPAPSAPSRPLDMADPQMDAVVAEMGRAFQERPIWTRRSLTNRLMDASPVFTDNIIKTAIPFVAYQFKGGPWRDAVIPYGLDPRFDQKYRVYQTLMFKTRGANTPNGTSSQPWTAWKKAETATRREAVQRPPGSSVAEGGGGDDDNQSQSQSGPIRPTGRSEAQHSNSHIFDGESFTTDGKVWQVCDVTDPLLATLFRNAAVRPTCDDSASGWYHRGLWAKARAIMKVKMLAITFGRAVADADFAASLAIDDGTPEPVPEGSKDNNNQTSTIGMGVGAQRLLAHVHVPVPDLGLSEAEIAASMGRVESRFRSGLNPRKRKRNLRGTTYKVAVGPPGSSSMRAHDAAVAASVEGEGTPAGDFTPIHRSIEEDINLQLQDEEEGDDDDDDGDDSEDQDPEDEEEGEDEDDEEEDDNGEEPERGDLVGGYDEDRANDAELMNGPGDHDHLDPLLRPQPSVRFALPANRNDSQSPSDEDDEDDEEEDESGEEDVDPVDRARDEYAFVSDDEEGFGSGAED